MFRILMKKFLGFDPAVILITIFLVVIAVVAIPNYGKVMNLFGHDTKQQLKDKLKTANDNVEIAVAVNKANEGPVAVLDDTVKNVEIASDGQAKAEKKIEKEITVIKQKKEKKIEIIFSQPEKPKEVKDREISEVQITSLWDGYCSFNTNSQCPSIPTPAS